MRKPIVFLFSGQGSHYYQMGRELFTQNSTFKQWLLTGDSIFQSQTGQSLLHELYSDQHKKSDIFKRTLFTHPAIFIVQYALAQTLIAEGIEPDLVVGTSLGEFAAAVVAGCIDFESALKTVILQAQLIESYCSPASMLAVLHSPEIYHTQSYLHQRSEMASSNFHQHFVLSSSLNQLGEIESFLKAQNITTQFLAVSHGFHSRYIDTAKTSFLEAINLLPLKPPQLSHISCIYAKQINNKKLDYFWDIIRKPILFQQTIQTLETENHYQYIDVGPAGTLTTFVKYNLASTSNSIILPTLLTPYGHKANAITHLKMALNL